MPQFPRFELRVVFKVPLSELLWEANQVEEKSSQHSLVPAAVRSSWAATPIPH